MNGDTSNYLALFATVGMAIVGMLAHSANNRAKTVIDMAKGLASEVKARDELITELRIKVAVLESRKDKNEN